MKHTFVLSDLHLAVEAPPDPVWMRFRQRCHFADDDFSALADELLAQVGDEPFEVVFAGDTFELDGANAYTRRPRERPADLGNEPSEALGLDRVLQDHPVFVAAVGRLLARAERVVFVTGNHDLGLGWPTTREVLLRRLTAAAWSAGATESPSELRQRVVFSPWLYRSEGVYVEHGQQYDPSSATPDPLLPRRTDGRGLWQSFGSAGYRHVLAGIGTMNPHNHDTYLLGGAWGYLRHFLRYYFGRRGRSLVWSWLSGSVRCARHLLAQRQDTVEPGTAQRWDALLAQAGPSGLTPSQLRQLRRLWVRPVTDRPYAVLRELWLDRVALVAVAVVVLGVCALLAPLPVTLLVAALLGAGLWAYERLAPDPDLAAFEAGLPSTAARIARITGDHVVVIGHTHRPTRQALPGGATLVNTGAWAPSFADPECTRPVNSDRTLAWIRHRAGARPRAALLAWQDGRFVAFDPRPHAAPRPAVPRPASAPQTQTDAA